MISETGQSGHAKHRHWDDFWQRWSAGEPVERPMECQQVEAAAAGRVILEPARCAQNWK